MAREVVVMVGVVVVLWAATSEVWAWQGQEAENWQHLTHQDQDPRLQEEAQQQEDSSCTTAAVYEGLVELGRQSTVYVFSFKNLAIVLMLKLFILVAVGALGTGAALGRSLGPATSQIWGQHLSHNSLQEPTTDGGMSSSSSLVDSSDVLFLLTYLVGQSIDRYQCLNRLACIRDQPAQDLLTAATMMMRAARMLGYSVEEYQEITLGMDDAIHYGRGASRAACQARYPCYAMPSL